PGGDQFTVTGPNFGLTVTAYNGSSRLPLGAGPTLRSVPGGRIVVEGGIYSFNSDVSVYLFSDAGSRVKVRSAVAIASATGKTNSGGRFTVTLTVPEDAAIGTYTLQVNGYSLLAATRSVNVGVVIEAMPWITVKFSADRSKSGRSIADGRTGEIVMGATLIPMLKLKGKSKFVRGNARPKVSEDGTFTWKRNIRKTTWVFFVWVDDGTMKPSEIHSNTLVKRTPPLRT
ncbi:MAG: hypothetical protein ACO38P_12920, partial [Phycisphaerales bacterium]